MFDAGFRCNAPILQRSVGELDVRFRLRGHLTTLDHLRQAGCLKARFPHPTNPSWMEVATVNISGGIVGGDTLTQHFFLSPETRVTIATQAPERIYRARSGDMPAGVQTSIEIAKSAVAEWLPQETILFNGAALRRSLSVNLHDGGRFLGIEALVFGRLSMGEAVHQLSLADTISIACRGRKLLHDVSRIHGDAEELLSRPAVANKARAVATLIYVAHDAAFRLDQLRTALPDEEAGVSTTHDLLVARILAQDGATLRRIVIKALLTLRGRPLPRAWMC
jgi:urease accessory protein